MTSSHGAHDDEAPGDGSGHGHGDDPNAGVVVGAPPTPAWVLTSFVIGLVTLAATVILAIALGGTPAGTSPLDDHAPGNTTMEQAEH
jgi:hypothetical protein